MAHGSIQGFGSDGEASNFVDPARAETAGLAYLAMGDWHRQIKISDRVWYSGTPEPDMPKRPPGSSGTLCNGGSALLVDIAGARAVPTVLSVEVGRYRWHQVVKTLTDDSQIDLLEAELRALELDLSKVVLDLHLTGTLSLAGRKRLEERIIHGVGAAVCGMRSQDAGLVLEPTEADMDDIDRAGFVRVAADRLKAIADGYLIQNARVLPHWPCAACTSNTCDRQQPHENTLGPSHQFPEVRRHRSCRWNHRWSQPRRPERTRQIDAA